MMLYLNLFLLLVSLSSVLGATLERPSNLPCKLDDVKCITDLTEWIVKSTILGIPDQKIPNLDPIDFEIIEGFLGYVKYKLTKPHIEALKTCKVTNASIKSNATTLHMEMLCRRTHLDGQYDIDGKILTYPITGKGIFNVDTTNYLCILDTHLAYYKRNNNLYLKHEDYTFICELMGEMDLDLKTLDGKKELPITLVNIIEFSRKNSKLFASLIDNPILAAVIRKFIKTVNKRLGLIPVTDMLLLNKVNVA